MSTLKHVWHLTKLQITLMQDNTDLFKCFIETYFLYLFVFISVASIVKSVCTSQANATLVQELLDVRVVGFHDLLLLQQAFM